MNQLEDIAKKLSAAKLPNIDFEKYLKSNIDDNERVKRVSDYYEEIEKFIERGSEMEGAKTPFRRLDNLFGFREGEVTLWSGYNGHKKSMLLG